MHFFNPAINRFLEDSCVIVTLAYFLSRFVSMKNFQEGSLHPQIKLALALAIVASSSLVFPGDRYPYVVFTLVAAFVGYEGNIRLGLLFSAFATTFFLLATEIGNLHWLPMPYILAIFAACFAGRMVGWGREAWTASRANISLSLPWILAGALLAGMAGEAVHQSILHGLFPDISQRARLPALWPAIFFYSTASNGLGCLLLSLILWDTQERQNMNRRQVQAEREIAALRLSQLGELQARLHPHFLFNTLAGIASLCVSSPGQAERSIVSLAALMRQFLRAPSDLAIPLQEEIGIIRNYLALEKLRFGDRLQIYENFAEEAWNIPVPRFCLQVPVENAIQHGLASVNYGGTVSIIVRRRRRYLLLAVGDNGAGFSTKKLPFGSTREPGRRKSRQEEWQVRLEGSDRTHGLELLAARLRLAYGETARLRLFSRPGYGSVCVLRLPLS